MDCWDGKVHTWRQNRAVSVILRGQELVELVFMKWNCRTRSKKKMLKKHYKPFNKPVSIHNPAQQLRWLGWISPVHSVVISSKVKIYCTEAMQWPVQMEQGLCPQHINSVPKEPQISKPWNISKTAWDKQCTCTCHFLLCGTRTCTTTLPILYNTSDLPSVHECGTHVHDICTRAHVYTWWYIHEASHVHVYYTATRTCGAHTCKIYFNKIAF